MRVLLAAAAAATLLVTGCAALPAVPATPPAAPSVATPVAAPDLDAATTAFLDRHGLTGLSPRQIVETLDASEEDREQGPIGSVRPSELVLSDEQEEVVVPIPEEFYLAFAPYRQQSHDCFNHNLASCRGELAEATVKLTVADASGAILVDQEVNTHANGFAGIWLPRDITGTITVTHEGGTASSVIATGPEDPTCLTTLQLS